MQMWSWFMMYIINLFPSEYWSLGIFLEPLIWKTNAGYLRRNPHCIFIDFDLCNMCSNILTESFNDAKGRRGLPPSQLTGVGKKSEKIGKMALILKTQSSKNTAEKRWEVKKPSYFTVLKSVCFPLKCLHSTFISYVWLLLFYLYFIFFFSISTFYSPFLFNIITFLFQKVIICITAWLGQ